MENGEHEEDESRTIKNKRVAIDYYPIGLRLKIARAENIDNPYLHPYVTKRHYGVAYWVDPGAVFCTRLAQGWVDPSWYEKNTILVGNNPDNYEFLNVEILRFNSMADPGTSNGRVVVGRARIPLPKELNHEKGGYFTLVRADGEGHKLEGHIVLSMKLKRIKIY